MEQIAPNIYVETNYEGVNVGAIVTPKGVIAIDAPSYTRQARDWAMRLNSLHPKGIQYTILTDYHGDRILNTRWLHAPVVAHQAAAARLQSYDRRYPAALLESLTARNPERGRELSHSPVQKAAVSFDRQISFFTGDGEIQLLAAPGPTPGSIWVYLPQTGILFSGDAVTTDVPPCLAEANTAQWLDTLARLRAMPGARQIVPGRGALCQMEAVDKTSHYLELARRRVETLVTAGRPLADTAVYVSELISLYPTPYLPLNWLRSHVQQSLNHLYHELQSEKDGIVLA